MYYSRVGDNPAWWIGNRVRSSVGGYNTAECGWDGGDCDWFFNEKYPNCKVAHPSWIEDERCDGGK